MSSVMSRIVLVLVGVMVVVAVIWGVRKRSSPQEETSAQPTAQGAAEHSAAAAASPQPSAPDQDESAPEEPAAQIPALPTPSAAWLQAPANPVRVAVTMGERKQQQRISPAGGTLNTTTADGTRVSVVFPPQALWRSEDVTIEVIERVTDAPFAAPSLAVRITPEDLPLQRPPVLKFEPGRRSATIDGGRPVAGFAVRGGVELALYPAGASEIERAPGRYRVIMALTRLGTYGAANATPDEITAVGAREPGDLAARLEQRIALAFARPAPAGAQGFSEPGWGLIPRAHAAQGMSVFIYELLKQVLESYQQVVVPKFDRLPTSDCLSGATFDAIQTYLQWKAGVELLLPLQEDPESGYDPDFFKLVLQREEKLRERGYTTGQIREIDRAIEEFRERFDALNAEIVRRIRPALSGQFSALYRCCTSQRPMVYHLTAMLKVMRFADVNGYAPIDSDPMPKLTHCACMVGSNQPGAAERFTGTLSYEENTALDKTTQQGSRTIVSSEKLTFQQSSILTFWRAGGMLANSSATGTLARFGSETDDRGSCVVTAETQTNVQGRDSGIGLVGIDVNPQQGTYNLSFNRLPLEGTGRRQHTWKVQGDGCGKFNRPLDKNDWTKEGISPVPDTSVRGELDEAQPQLLKGSKTFERVDSYYGAPRTATLKWDLQRCRID